MSNVKRGGCFEYGGEWWVATTDAYDFGGSVGTALRAKLIKSPKQLIGAGSEGVPGVDVGLTIPPDTRELTQEEIEEWQPKT